MVESVLLDTGVLVALASRSDPDHRRCVELMNSLRARLVTVEGVLVEASFLVRSAPGGPEKVLELFRLLQGTRHAVSDAGLARVAQLMTRYSRMDLVDGLLVVAAEELRIQTILTLDRRDFSIYRLRSGRALKLLP